MYYFWPLSGGSHTLFRSGS